MQGSIVQFPPKRVKYRHGHPFLFLFLPYLQETSLCSQPVRGNVRRTWRIFPEHVERSFLDPEYSFVAVRRILRTILMKQKFAQLRIDYESPNTSNYVREQIFAQLRTGFRSSSCYMTNTNKYDYTTNRYHKHE